jgi:hypothetical protein
MHDLTNLKEMLVKELEEFGKSGTLSKASLDNIDKLAHATKNVIKVIECCEQDEYSHRMGRSYSDGRSYGDMRSYRNDGYSYSSNPKGELYRLIETTSDERTKDELRRILDRI